MDTLTQHANALEDIVVNYMAGLDAMSHLQGLRSQIGYVRDSLGADTQIEEVVDVDADKGYAADEVAEESSTFYTVMSSTNNSVPTLNSLVTRADALMKSPPAADADFLAITAFFNEAATINVRASLR
ncbi:hypothetical protein IW261DRAFT_1574905 [Armillaria novae-zelandiae]|uniref:Uncharacterized protein n=1 Tax=Armillaria novae-zelandiae TaxID=153914 RepID=A0AA39NHF1_9AGAR|nr:hypothetical protein IW261DRAFT_1574905 [Armillaria novae-zelandiae]